MKIVIVGSVYVNVNIKLSTDFDPLGSNKGEVETSYSSDSIELAKKLADEGNEVIFISSIDTQCEPYVIRMLKAHNIDCKYMCYEPNGTGFVVNFVDSDIHTVSSFARCSNVLQVIKDNKDDIFENTSALILDYIDGNILALSKSHEVPVYLLQDEPASFEFDIDDAEFKKVKSVLKISLSNYTEVLS